MDKQTRKLKKELKCYLRDTMGNKKNDNIFLTILFFPVFIVKGLFNRNSNKEVFLDDSINKKPIETKSIKNVDEFNRTIDLSTLVDDIKKSDKEAKLYDVENIDRTSFQRKILSDDNIFDAEFYEEDILKKDGLHSKLKDCLYDSDLDSFIDNNVNEENKFQKLLFKYIDRTDMLDSDVYTNAGIDRRLFSKIRNNENYHPSKETVIQLGIGLKLNLDELLSLLDSASYSLPMNNYFDLIIRWCFKKNIYNLIVINELLYDYNCKLLGRD